MGGAESLRRTISLHHWVDAHLLQPTSSPQDADFDNKILSADNSASHVYHEFVRGKTGSAGKGSTRRRHIRRDHVERGIPPPRAYSVVDMASLTEDAQREGVEFLLTEFERYRCPRVPETLREDAGA